MHTRRRRVVDSPIGQIIVVADDNAITNIYFPNEEHARAETAVEAPTDPILDAAAVQLAEYFACERTTFDLPLHLEGNPFELDVWNAMRSIPYGETISYGQQADIAGHPGAFQAVGAANGRNPIPIVIPCHRVIGSDGSLTGFGGGLDLKRQLLDMESGVQTLPF